MASKGNTWFKKLQTKGKAHALKAALGNEKGVMSFAARTHNTQARALNRDTTDDKPVPTGPKIVAKKVLPRVDGWKPESYPVKLPARPLNSSYGTRGPEAWR